MYCICCKKNNVIPFDSRQSQKIPANKLETEEDILWKKEKRKDGSLSNVNNEMIDNGIIQIENLIVTINNRRGGIIAKGAVIDPALPPASNGAATQLPFRVTLGAIGAKGTIGDGHNGAVQNGATLAILISVGAVVDKGAGAHHQLPHTMINRTAIAALRRVAIKDALGNGEIAAIVDSAAEGIGVITIILCAVNADDLIVAKVDPVQGDITACQ